MNTLARLSISLLALGIAACAAMHSAPQEVRSSLAPGKLRIGVTQGSTSSTTLPGWLKSAAIVPAPSMKRPIEMLSNREVDAFATNKANLFEMSDAVAGSRVLDGNWGVEHLAIAIPKGRDAARPWLASFVAEARREGFVTRAVERAGLRGTKADE